MRAGVSTLMSSFFTDFERSTKTSGLAAPRPEGRMQVPAVLPSSTGKLVQQAVVSGRATVAFYSSLHPGLHGSYAVLAVSLQLELPAALKAVLVMRRVQTPCCSFPVASARDLRHKE